MKKDSKGLKSLMKLKMKGFWRKRNIFGEGEKFLLIMGEKEERLGGKEESFKEERFLRKMKCFCWPYRKNERFKESFLGKREGFWRRKKVLVCLKN